MEQSVDRTASIDVARDACGGAVVSHSGRDDRGAALAAKIASLAEFAAGAGHEINNPLATIIGRAQLLLRDETDSNRRRDLATIVAQAIRIRDMIGDLMLFARPPAPSPRRLVLSELVRSVADRLSDEACCRNCRLAVRIPATVFATADADQLCIVVSELVRNAIGAVDESGVVEIGAWRATLDGRLCAVLSVADNGRGLSAKDREHLFDPFYSGREAGRGLGFGLCKCWRIVANHGGWIDVESTPGAGSTFRVFLPDDGPARSAAAVPPSG